MILTISDNVATDELLALVGPAQINQLTAGLGPPSTRITGDLGMMLDAMARETGFTDYPALARPRPGRAAPVMGAGPAAVARQRSPRPDPRLVDHSGGHRTAAPGDLDRHRRHPAGLRRGPPRHGPTVDPAPDRRRVRPGRERGRKEWRSRQTSVPSRTSRT
jgi:hypothetical protein